MDEELQQTVRDIVRDVIREELSEINERLVNVESMVIKLDANVDKGVAALKNKPGMSWLFKSIKQDHDNEAQ